MLRISANQFGAVAAPVIPTKTRTGGLPFATVVPAGPPLALWSNSTPVMAWSVAPLAVAMPGPHLSPKPGIGVTIAIALGGIVVGAAATVLLGKWRKQKASRRRDTWRYVHDVRGYPPDPGVTNNPPRRFRQRNRCRPGGRMFVIGPSVTRASALGWERRMRDAI